jgi:ATP adenylyltransferase
MERLWRPWRLDYVTGSKADVGCVFCTEQTLPPSDSLIVHTGRAVLRHPQPISLQPRPPDGAAEPHRAGARRLSVDELHELADLTRLAEAALVNAYQPQASTSASISACQAGAGIREHLHVHLVPRWNGDTNFISVVGETRVLPEDLQHSTARLRRLRRSGPKNLGAGEQ